MAHLPYEETEDDYLEESHERIDRIEADLGNNDPASGEEIDDADAEEIAALFASWVASKWSANRLRPTSTVPVNANERSWFDRHVSRSYTSGAQDAEELLRAKGYSPPRTPSVTDSPTHRQALKQVYSKQREYWQKLTDELEDDVRSAVKAAVRDGGTAADARSAVSDRLEHKARYRSRLIAETETARAYNWGLLSEYEQAGVNEVSIEEIEWETAGDQRVCSDCALNAGTYSIDEAKNLLMSGAFPEHPRCRCLLVPA